MHMLSKSDKKYLEGTYITKDDAKIFVTKDYLKKALKNHPTHDQLQKTVRDELDTVKPDWIREITDSVSKALGDKIDNMYVKLDSFIGEIKARREEDTLHTKQHSDIDDRLETVEKKLGLPTYNI